MTVITYTCMRNLDLKVKVETMDFKKQKYVLYTKKIKPILSQDLWLFISNIYAFSIEKWVVYR